MSAPHGSRRADGPDGRGPHLLLVVGLFVLALVLLGGSGFLLLRGDDGADPATAARSTGTSDVQGSDSSGFEDDEPTDEPDPLDDPLSPESIDQRYSRLADSVTAGSERCRSVKARQGQRERLKCDAPVGTLELVTYRRALDLDERRARAVTYEPGGILDATRRGTLMAREVEAGGRRGADDPGTFLYWDDSQARQSAAYLAPAGTDLAPLVASYDGTGPVRPYPAGPTDRRLVAFVERWVQPGDCVRIGTVNAGSTEESYCDVDGPVETFVGRFRTAGELEAYRGLVVASAIADEREIREWKRGALYEYTTDDGTVVRYWDDPSCACYAEAFLADGSYQALARWWDR